MIFSLLTSNLLCGIPWENVAKLTAVVLQQEVLCMICLQKVP